MDFEKEAREIIDQITFGPFSRNELEAAITQAFRRVFIAGASTMKVELASHFASLDQTVTGNGKKIAEATDAFTLPNTGKEG